MALEGLKESAGLWRPLKGPGVLWVMGGSEELRRALDGSGVLWRALEGFERPSTAVLGSGGI